MGACAFIKEINGLKCVTDGFSINKKGKSEQRHVVLICDKDGNVKSKITEKEIVKNEENQYREISYVAFDEEDKYLDCRMTIDRNEDGTINTDNVYIGALLYGYGCNISIDAYYLVPCNECIMIYSNAKDPMDYDYKTFDFDNINSYERFGKYANAVMIAFKKIKSNV